MSTATMGLALSADVCAWAGISYRQLDYWVRTGVVTARRNPGGSGGGRERGFTPLEVEGIRRLAVLTQTLGAFPSAFARQVFEGPGPWSSVTKGRKVTVSIEWAENPDPGGGV